MMILAGDIGGTKTNLALFQVEGDTLQRGRSQSFRSADYGGLSEVIRVFLGAEKPALHAAAFGIAGPVVENRTRTPNLAWTEVDGAAVAAELGIARVDLLNDLVATALGAVNLGPDELVTLQEGLPGRGGPVAVIAAGTGLGMTVLLPTPHGPVVMPSEGGHVDYGARNPEEIALLRYLHDRLGGRVSVERVVSGGGLFNLYCFLRDTGFAPELPEVNAALQQIAPDRVGSEAGRVLSQHAPSCPMCHHVLELFAAAYGAMAGNLALLAMATGGVYIGGGIAPKNLALLQEGGFMAAFLDKGRYTPLLQTFPVRVILNQETALLGAAKHAAR